MLSETLLKSNLLQQAVPSETSADCENNMAIGRWRKLKGIAMVRLADGSVMKAEVHWYEAHGIGRKEVKVKRLLKE